MITILARLPIGVDDATEFKLLTKSTFPNLAGTSGYLAVEVKGKLVGQDEAKKDLPVIHAVAAYFEDKHAPTDKQIKQWQAAVASHKISKPKKVKP